ncbi:terpene cyclase/mutase family protein [Streptomyces scopuliridis]|uniref:prenyltransferase/squalene oxidase repeat-containing protein n=1 Tax=Streptomyces scopuliridis TaxID=452529 RepID=UPI002DD87710|nr:prenyltransferase/squalene oxidase repeat-containing protein [Streptomyces scopuliridis]WSB31441.1 terpene cyclase/mutase family protein [Streptomyces scopuliridis]
MRPPEAGHALPDWPAGLFPPELGTARGHLTDHLLRQIGPDGALRDPCGSRVLESALLLALLDRTGTPSDFGAARSRLVRFLRHPRRHGSRWDEIFSATVLGKQTRSAPAHGAADDFIARAPQFTAPRKRLLFQAIFVMLGSEPSSSGCELFPPRGLHPWASMQVTATKVVLVDAAARAELIGSEDIALLLSTQRPGEVWEGNLLIHLLVLHALSRLPGNVITVMDGIRTVLLHQRDDGGVPFVTDTDTWTAVTAGLALCNAGAPRGSLDRIAQHVLRLQHPSGGWSYTDHARLADTDCTTVALEFLHVSNPHAYRTPVQRGIQALLSVRGGDGGFPTYADTPSEACMTAAVINVLAAQGSRYQLIMDEGMTFLACSQRPDGSFPPGWSDSRLHTLFRAHLATRLFTAGRAPVVRERIVRLVRSSQNDDGGWGKGDGTPSDAISTAYGLIVAAGLPDHLPAVRAVEYLLSQQNSDGKIEAPPDMVGPRPLPYHVPLLSDAFSLLSLGHLTRRITPDKPAVSGQPHTSPDLERTP